MLAPDSNEIVESLHSYFILKKTENERNSYLNSLNNKEIVSIINQYKENFIDSKFDSEEINESNSFYSFSEFSYDSSYLKMIMNNYYLESLLEVKLFFQRNYYLTIIQEGKKTEIFQRLEKNENPWFMSLFSLKNKSDEEIDLMFLDTVINDMVNKNVKGDEKTIKKIDELLIRRGDLVEDIIKQKVSVK